MRSIVKDLGRQAFFAVWLTMWSVGVAFIGAALAEGSLPLLLFALTHGGSEIFVLYWFTRRLRADATRPTYPRLEEDLGETVMTWRAGSATAASLTLSLVVPALVYGILAYPIVTAFLSGTTLLGGLVHTAFAVVWLTTLAVFWVPTWRALVRGMTTHELRIRPRSLVLVERRPGGTRRATLAASRVELRRVPEASHVDLFLRADDIVWQGRLATGAMPVLDRLAALLEQARREERGADVPDDLEALRVAGDPANAATDPP